MDDGLEMDCLMFGIMSEGEMILFETGIESVDMGLRDCLETNLMFELYLDIVVTVSVEELLSCI